MLYGPEGGKSRKTASFRDSFLLFILPICEIFRLIAHLELVYKCELNTGQGNLEIAYKASFFDYVSSLFFLSMKQVGLDGPVFSSFSCWESSEYEMRVNNNSGINLWRGLYLMRICKVI